MLSVPPMNGIYNISPDANEPYQSYQSVSKLPPNREFHRETRAIAACLRERIQRYLLERSFPKYNEILETIFDENSIGEFPSDRTMCFFVGDLDAFTHEFVVMLQREILNELTRQS